jgi:hypothetical protein
MDIDPIDIVIGAAVFLLAAPVIVLVDKRRIRRHIASSGSQVMFIRWRPFKGSDLSELLMREYDIVYKDPSGQGHHCMSKVALLSDIYLLEDTVETSD